MKHRARVVSRILIAVSLLGAIAAGGLVLRQRTTERPPDVPTFVVIRAKLVRTVRAEGTMRAVKSTRVTPPDVRDPLKIIFIAEDGTPVKKGQVVIRFDDSDFTERLIEGKDRRAQADARIARERQSGELAVKNRERAAQMADEQQQLAARFQIQDTEIFSNHQIVESSIDQDLNAARVGHAKEAKTIQRKLANDRVGLISVDRKKADLDIEQANKDLRGLEVLAPHEGIFVLSRNEWGQSVQVGDLAWRRNPLAEVSRLEDLEAEVFVLEADASGLEVGREAVLTLESDSQTEYRATVKRIGTLAKRRHPRIPAQYFEVALTLDKVDPAVMKPGKRVLATLTLGNDEGLVVPRQAVFERDGSTIVYRLEGDSFQPAKVVLGSSSPGRVLVEEGLKAGDVIAQHDPNQTLRVERPDAAPAPSSAPSPSLKSQ